MLWSSVGRRHDEPGSGVVDSGPWRCAPGSPPNRSNVCPSMVPVRTNWQFVANPSRVKCKCRMVPLGVGPADPWTPGRLDEQDASANAHAANANDLILMAYRRWY